MSFSRFITVMSIRILCVQCDSNRLRQELGQLDLDVVYSIALCCLVWKQ